MKTLEFSIRLYTKQGKVEVLSLLGPQNTGRQPAALRWESKGSSQRKLAQEKILRDTDI